MLEGCYTEAKSFWAGGEQIGLLLVQWWTQLIWLFARHVGCSLRDCAGRF